MAAPVSAAAAPAAAPVNGAAAAAAPAAAAAAGAPRVALTDQLVLEYLRARGYSATEQQLKSEATSTGSTGGGSAGGAGAVTGAAAAIEVVLTGALDAHTHTLGAIGAFSAPGAGGVGGVGASELSPDTYRESYRALATLAAAPGLSGAAAARDVTPAPAHRAELSKLLWPLYVHTFVELFSKNFIADAQKFLELFRPLHEPAHTTAVRSLMAIKQAAEFQSNEYVQVARRRKSDVSMSATAHSVLKTFVEQRKLTTLQRLIVSTISIKIVSNRSVDGEPEVVPKINTEHVVKWGLLQEIVDLYREASSQLRAAANPAPAPAAASASAADGKADSKSADMEDDPDPTGASPQKKQKTGAGAAAATAAPAAAAAAAAAAAKAGKKGAGKKDDGKAGNVVGGKKVKIPFKIPNEVMDKPSIPLPVMADGFKSDFIADLQSRTKLSPKALPSIAFATFLNGHKRVTGISVSRDGSMVSAGFNDSTVRVWDLNTPEASSGAATGTTADHIAQAIAAAAGGGGGGGSTAAAAPASASASSSASGAIAGANGAGAGAPGASAAAATATATSASAATAATRAITDRSPYTKLVGHTGPVYATAFSPDAQFVVSASEDSTVRLWHTATKYNLVCYRGHTGPVWDVDWSALGYYFATASHDMTARLWATDKIQPLRVFVGHDSDVECVRFHPNCNYLATGSADTTVRLWDVQTGDCVRLFLGHSANGGAGSVHSSSSSAAAAAAAAATGGTAGSPITALAMSPDGRMCASGSDDGRIWLWDLGSGKRVHRVPITAHVKAVTCLDFSADSTLLCSGGMDQAVRLFDLKKFGGSAADDAAAALDAVKPLCTFRTKNTPVTALRFTPRNLLIAAGVFIL